jgi:pimeloyl-ACP methyl ester carboxylesterase
VHGAWADSSSWDAVVARLQRDGYTVYVPPNPLLGLTYDSAYLRDFLHTITGPIILVGHSYGGAVPPSCSPWPTAPTPASPWPPAPRTCP